MNRFATSILFVPVEDDKGEGYVNVANIEYYSDGEDGGLDLYLISGMVLHVEGSSKKEFTAMLMEEAKRISQS